MSASAAIAVRVEIEGLEGVAIDLERGSIVEAISHVTTITLEARLGERVDAEALLGKTLALRLTHGADESDERAFHGVIFCASVTCEHEGGFRIELEARPRIGRLLLGRDSRIFQEKSVPDVVAEVLSAAGLPDDVAEWSVNASYEPQAYITQLEESDHDFAQRLLHEEGIGFFICNDIDAERVVFFDDSNAFQPVGDGSPIPYETDQRGDGVLWVRELHRVASDAAVLRDYDFLQPATDLTQRSEAEGATGREVYLHPGDFTESGRGERLARVALERLSMRARTFSGESGASALEPGRVFEVSGHPRASVAGELVAIAVTHRLQIHQGSGPTYRNHFVAIPRETPCRPEVAPPAPIIGGTHVAFVTGAAGQELHGSENGQVKVRFPWDRSGVSDDRSSTWLRVGQLPLPGSMIVPRVGFEVLVDYELGDHDRPLVVGHLYNGEAMPPYELPGAATRSSIQTATTDGGAGANELRFEDAAGGEEMFVNASFDYTCSVENDARVGVMASETSSIGSNQTISVTGSYSSSVGGARTLTIGGNQTLGVDADYSNGTGGDLSVTVGSRSETCGGDLTENTTGSYTLTVGGLMAVTGIAGINRNIVGSSETTVGAAWASLCAGDAMSTVGTSRTETVGALKLVKADTVAVSCGAAYVQNCASESVNAGGNRADTAMGAVAVQAGGGLKIDAANINISGQTKVVLRIGGTTIDVQPSSVTIKSSTVTLEGVKKLQSLSEHETT